MSAPAVFAVNCHKCGAFTTGRCPSCKAVAYCSDRCRELDTEAHVASCGHHQPSLSDLDTSMNIFQRYQKERPIGWRRILKYIENGNDCDRKLILCSLADDQVFLSSWDNVKEIIDPRNSGTSHPVKQSLDTRNEDQHNVLVFTNNDGFFHNRFSLKRIAKSSQ